MAMALALQNYLNGIQSQGFSPEEPVFPIRGRYSVIVEAATAIWTLGNLDSMEACHQGTVVWQIVICLPEMICSGCPSLINWSWCISKVLSSSLCCSAAQFRTRSAKAIDSTNEVCKHCLKSRSCVRPMTESENHLVTALLS